ncbi:glycosyltransferase [Knoellia koreensis]|uniref:Glycosyltransferase n=1 Tax=Knoellia koreensis TaxID=2730921 RepID=A0A849HIR3_9MICO|nr:glycosyltransferase [Knoellia sp. DB2414S]NNM44577.1 glycosyltransferase [Knoellia sp. DB2414S]
MSAQLDVDRLSELARVVLPVDGDLDVLPLYVDTRKSPKPPKDDTDSPVVIEASGPAVVPDQVLGRRRFRLEHGQGVSFATYFNAFPASYWKRYTSITEVVLQVRTNGPGTLFVYRSTGRGSVVRVTSATVRGEHDERVRLPLDTFADGGWYWFDLVAGDGPLTLESAAWLGAPEEVAPRATGTGRITIGITTMNRPAYCTALLTQLGEAPDLCDVIDEVIVVDQGTERVRDHEGFAAAREACGDRLRVIEQANLGGSGGFSRSMLETLDGGRSDHVLILDDDVICEPEGIARTVAFANACRRPTVVGGHMFSMYDRSVLHAFAEVILPWQFRWGPAEPTVHDHDLASTNLRATPWLHRRMHSDYTGWWMCLIPVTVLRECGLSMPFFIKWDDAEYGLRAAEHGFPTVSLPGAAVWHVPWTDKDDAVDWQAYYHARSRLVAALTHSQYDRGGRMVRESLFIQLKHLLAMQYSAAALRQRAIEDVLSGPQDMHASLATRLGEVRQLRQQFDDAVVRRSPEEFAPVRRTKLRKRDSLGAKPVGTAATMLAAGSALVRQLRPVDPRTKAHPEREVAAADAGWWTLARLDSALVTTADGKGMSWHKRDRSHLAAAIRDAVEAHEQLLRDWPRLSRLYRDSMPDLVGPDAWRKTLDVAVPDEAPQETADPRMPHEADDVR